jgi:hypothetical protein
MREVKALLLGAVCAGAAVSGLAQEGIAPAPAYQPSGAHASGAAAGLQVPRAERGWTGGILIDSPHGQGFSPGRPAAADSALGLRPDFRRSLAEPFAPPVDPASAMQAGAYLGYRFGNSLLLSSAVRQGLSAPGAGTKVDFGASYGFNVTPRHLITLSGALTLGQTGGSAPYYSTFGRTDYRPGEPGAGFRLSWRYSFGRNLYLNTILGYDRMYGDPEAMPGQDRNSTSFGTYFGYRW